MWWLYVIKFIASLFGVFSTALFVNSMIASIVSGPNIFHSKEETKTNDRDAALRVVLAIIMSISWSVLIVF